ncbi:MAG: DUF1559 domain-containing protein [Thermoguttaceae bacterium]
MRHFADRSSNKSLPAKKAISAGFTLVELLAVVVIISMLVGLMLPALIGARARARIAQCCHNQGELGKAIIQYEVAKNKLPGYANHISTGTSGSATVGYTVSWVPVLFPYLGRMDLWEGTTGTDSWRRVGTNGNTPATPTSMPLLVCPDDELPNNGTLSYVVSVGSATDATGGSATQNSVFRNLSMFPQKAITLSSVKSPSRRPMLSERTYMLDTTAETSGRCWDARGQQNYAMVERCGFRWPDVAPVTDADKKSVSEPFIETKVSGDHPIHAGIVNITFCDGHVESVSIDATCDAFDYAPITQ